MRKWFLTLGGLAMLALVVSIVFFVEHVEEEKVVGVGNFAPLSSNLIPNCLSSLLISSSFLACLMVK